MTNTLHEHEGQRRIPAARRSVPSLSLRQTVPADWHDDRPAYAGDPDMDWENKPEPPAEPKWGSRPMVTRSGGH